VKLITAINRLDNLFKKLVDLEVNCCVASHIHLDLKVIKSTCRFWLHSISSQFNNKKVKILLSLFLMNVSLVTILNTLFLT